MGELICSTPGWPNQQTWRKGNTANNNPWDLQADITQWWISQTFQLSTSMTAQCLKAERGDRSTATSSSTKSLMHWTEQFRLTKKPTEPSKINRFHTKLPKKINKIAKQNL